MPRKPLPAAAPTVPPAQGLDAIVENRSLQFTRLLLEARSAQQTLHAALVKVAGRITAEAGYLTRHGVSYRVDTLFTTFKDEHERCETTKAALVAEINVNRSTFPHLLEAGLSPSKVVAFLNDEGKPAYWLGADYARRDYIRDALAEIGSKSTPQ